MRNNVHGFVYNFLYTEYYYDLYAPLVSSVKLDYTPEDAQRLVLGAVAPIFGVSQAAQAVDEFLAHLLGDDGGAWLAHS